MVFFDEIKFDERGLVPAIAQDFATKEVLMLAWMSKESLNRTITAGKACYYSRSRKKLWLKGETSGHFQHIKSIKYDCDGDTLLLEVEQVGSACHTGNKTCFYRQLELSDQSHPKPETS
jgi:phosphoribosyl-ATP pyrophosphohydrolase/phosphoribosyl-AMP cyclohydrolase